MRAQRVKAHAQDPAALGSEYPIQTMLFWSQGGKPILLHGMTMQAPKREST